MRRSFRHFTTLYVHPTLGRNPYAAPRHASQPKHNHLWMNFLLAGMATVAASLSVQAFASTPASLASLSVAAMSASVNPANLPDAPQPSLLSAAETDAASAQAPSNEATPRSKQQPKRILGIMPNYRAVSAGTKPPPPTPKQAFKMATQNSFDYSSFVFVGLTSLIAEGNNSHPQLGKGVPGFWAYGWRGFTDKTIGNYLVLFALPTVFHQDERYYTLGTGSIWRRTVYSLSSVIITPNYQGNKSFNISELLGRGMAQGISTTYYPSKDRTAGELATKYGYSIMRDALTNSFREFWPDIATHVLRRNP